MGGGSRSGVGGGRGARMAVHRHLIYFVYTIYYTYSYVNFIFSYVDFIFFIYNNTFVNGFWTNKEFD